MSDSMPQLFIGSVKRLLKEDYWEVIEAEGNFELKERQAKMEISITGAPNNGLKISLPPKGKAHTAMIADKTGYKSSCDYLILIPRLSGVIDVYFIELKRTLHGNGIPHEASQQILSTIPVWYYLVLMIDIHFAEQSRIKRHFIEKNFINKHFVVIAERGAEKLVKGELRQGYRGEYQSNGRSFKVIHSFDEIPLKALRCQNP